MNPNPELQRLAYPRGAFTIAQLLESGKRPAGPVIVSLNGDPGWDNATVLADPRESYRWDWVKGLPSVVVTMGKDTRLGSILADILQSEPGQLDVIDTERVVAWMVLRARPKLRAVRWPAHWVADWLGEGFAHAELNAVKARFGLEVA